MKTDLRLKWLTVTSRRWYFDTFYDINMFIFHTRTLKLFVCVVSLKRGHAAIPVMPSLRTSSWPWKRISSSARVLNTPATKGEEEPEFFTVAFCKAWPVCSLSPTEMLFSDCPFCCWPPATSWWAAETAAIAWLTAGMAPSPSVNVRDGRQIFSPPKKYNNIWRYEQFYGACCSPRSTPVKVTRIVLSSPAVSSHLSRQ